MRARYMISGALSIILLFSAEAALQPVHAAGYGFGYSGEHYTFGYGGPYTRLGSDSVTRFYRYELGSFGFGYQPYVRRHYHHPHCGHYGAHYYRPNYGYRGYSYHRYSYGYRYPHSGIRFHFDLSR